MLLFLDFETHYDNEYSLAKMPTLAYVRDARFRCLGAAVSIPNALPPTYFEPDKLQMLLDRLPWDQIAVIAHNAAFDGAVLVEHYGHKPRRWVCTQNLVRYAVAQGWLPPDQTSSVAANAPRYGLTKGDTAAAVAAGGQALADYALVDLLVCQNIYEELHDRTPALELALIDLHVRMAVDARLLLDKTLLQSLTADVPDWQAKLRSKEAFAQALTAAGVDLTNAYKTSEKTGKQDYAFAKTDAFMRSLQVHPDPKVRMLTQLRLDASSSIERTRAERFLQVGEPFPVPLQYYGAHTGRSSGNDLLNLQNLGRNSPLRAALKAPDGHKLVVIDSSQIEVRVLAWLAQERELQRVFAEGRDPYVAFAERLYGIPAADVTKAQRSVAKAAVLALGYGQGALGFITYCEIFGVAVTQHEAERVVAVYRATHPRVVALWGRTFNIIARKGELPLPSGRLLTYPDRRYQGRDLMYQRHSIFSKARKGQRDEVKLWPGLAVENQVQAVARDVVLWQTAALAQDYTVIHSVHDEAVLCVPEDQAERAKRAAETAFSVVPAWAEGLLVTGEAAIADNYGEAK